VVVQLLQLLAELVVVHKQAWAGLELVVGHTLALVLEERNCIHLLLLTNSSLNLNSNFPSHRLQEFHRLREFHLLIHFHLFHLLIHRTNFSLATKEIRECLALVQHHFVCYEM
jgi:hypothetical protein